MPEWLLVAGSFRVAAANTAGRLGGFFLLLSPAARAFLL
jgi:hypothetical protein